MNGATYYSEFGEDKWIAENLTLPETGFYIDAGCGHPTIHNNTAFLRDRGWNGMAIDANDGYAGYWQDGVFIQAFVSDQPLVSFSFKKIAGHSRVEESPRRYATTSLLRLLGVVKQPAPAPWFDFLSLDLEGHEFNALMSLEGQLPRVIVSEYSTEGLFDDMRVKEYLERNGYRLVHTTKANHVFTRD